MQQQREDLETGGGERTQEVHDWLDGAIRATVDAQHRPPARPRPTAQQAPPVSPRRVGQDEKQGVKQNAKSVQSYRRSLDPIRVALPAYNSSEGRSSPFLRYGLIIGGAAIVAYGIATFSPQQRNGGTSTAEAARSSPAGGAATNAASIVPGAAHLIVHDQQVFANDPLPLDVAVDRSLANASLRVAGLAAGTHLSAGSPVGDSGWTVPLDGVKNLFMYAPTDFVGVMHGALDLRGPDKKTIDRREVKLEWVERKKDPARVSEPDAAANTAPPVNLIKEASASPNPAIGPVVTNDPATSTPVTSPVVPSVVVKEPTMSKETADALMQRGEDSLKTGDIVTARMLFGRLADAGIADAAFAAAETYDSAYLNAHHVLGVAGDEAKAREFYQRAAQLGSTDAAAHLAGVVAK